MIELENIPDYAILYRYDDPILQRRFLLVNENRIGISDKLNVKSLCSFFHQLIKFELSEINLRKKKLQARILKETI